MDNQVEQKIQEKAIDIKRILNVRQFRESSIIESGKIDKEKRTVDLSFSSELPVERWFGMEILDHNLSSADLSRLNKGAAVLVDHFGDQVGVVESAEIRDKKGYARIKLSRSQRGQEVFQDIVDGIRKNVSFAYLINNISEEAKGIFRATSWTPLEISVVGIPADASIGIGRSINDVEVKEVKDFQIKQVKESKTSKGDEVIMEQEAKKSEQKRVEEILAIAEKHPELMRDAKDAISKEVPLEEFQKLAMERLYSAKPLEIAKGQDVMEIGMSKKELKGYSIVNGIRALMLGDKSKAPLEFEVSRELAKKVGKDARGFFVPSDVLKRTLAAGTSSAGGHTVATDLLASSFIDLLRNKMVIMQSGAQMLNGLVGDIAIPKQSGGATAYWVNEGTAPAESQQLFGQISLKPKTVGAYTDYTRKLMLQSSIDIEQFVRNDLATTLALEIDRAAINGSGVGAEPKGILKNQDVSIVSLGTNGGSPAWSKIVKLETAVDQNNAAIGTLKYLTNARVRGTLKTTEKTGNTAKYIMDDTGMVNGYECLISNQIPSNITKGTGVDLSAMIFGNFNDLIFGMWGALDVNVDPYSLSTSGSIRVIALQDIDVAIRHTESFAAITDMITI